MTQWIMSPIRTDEGEIREKLKWLIALRVVIVTALLGASIVLNSGNAQPPDSAFIFSSLIAGTYFLTIVYSLILNRIRRVRVLAYAQIGLDLGLETYLVYLTGGLESPFSPFYMITIVAAGIVLGRKGGSLTASTAAILFGTLVDLHYFGILPVPGGSTYSDRTTLYLLFMNIVAFLTVAYLSGSLVQKLSQAQESLKEKSAGLAELKAFHECVVQSMSSGLLTTSLDGRITSFNRAAEEITGYSLSDVKGRPWWEPFQAEDMKTLISSEEPLADPVRFDRTCRRKDGVSLLLGMTVSPLRNEEGRQVGGVWIFQNLTRIRQMEEEIENKKRLATIGEMAAGMAHEIRNPLAALSGSMQVLKTGFRPDDEEFQHLLEIALKETDRLDDIITAFLLYARPAPLNKKPSDINLLVADTIGLLQNRKETSKNIDVRTDLHKEELWAMVDPDQIRQVFWNLSINAVEAMEKGGRLKVSSRLVTTLASNGAAGTPWVEVAFSDTGRGISEPDLGKIFYPFFTTKDHGSGLGLSIVHRIVEDHQGRIHVESRPGEGARFALLLPADDTAGRSAGR